MAQNQQNKPYSDALASCRSEIDNIDDQILQLLSKRMQVVEKVRDLKKSHGENFFIKSAREADMIKDLVSKADPLLKPSTIVNIWRKIITNSNILEQSLKIALHNPLNQKEYDYMLREYYSDMVPIISHDSINNVVLEIQKNNAQIAVFALPKANDAASGDEWWINLANNKMNLKVFAQVPLVQTSHEPVILLALAVKTAEQSQADKSLFCIELDKNHSRSALLNALQESGIGTAKILKTTRLKQIDDIVFYLVEADGFFDENSKNLQQLQNCAIRPFVKVLGHYPVAITA